VTAQPTHADVFGIASELCVSTITEVEGALASQRMSDAAEAFRHQEEEILKAEMARIAAENEEHERQERLKQLEQDRLDIEAAERQLRIRKQALRNAQEGRDVCDDDSNSDNGGGVSAPAGNQVRHILIHSVYSLLTVMSDISGNNKGQDEASTG